MWHDATSLRRALLISPGPAFGGVTDLAAHNFRQPPDLALAQYQHGALCETLVNLGVEVVLRPEMPGHPNSVFVQDPAVVVGRYFVRMCMGLPTRRGEPAWLAGLLQDQGLDELRRILQPGTAEGGDVVLLDGIALVGRSRRTNDEGVRQLASILSSQGYEVRQVSVPSPSLHLGGVVTAVGPRSVLACSSVLPSDALAGLETIDVPQLSFISGNVIVVDSVHVIAEARNRAAIAALEAHGRQVTALDLSAFVGSTGGPSCLVLPLVRGG